MSFFVAEERPNPSGFARFGRLVQWTTWLFAAFLLMLAWSAWNTPAPKPSPDGLYVSVGLPWDTWTFFAAIVAMIGRGFRYLMSGE